MYYVSLSPANLKWNIITQAEVSWFFQEERNPMNERDPTQASTLQRPTTDDTEAWKVYWKAQGQPWRTEPEIDNERQKILAERHRITPDIERGIYPFKDMRLSRADVEWLLATHAVLGTVDWKDVLLREHEGIDVRGANLAHTDLSYLPLALLRGGLNYREWEHATEEQRNGAAVRLEGADLKDASLKGASLRGAHLEGAYLRWVQFEGADLMCASLEGAYLRFALMEKAHLRDACLERADLRGALFAGAYLDGIMICDVNCVGPLLADTQWNDVNLSVVKWSEIKMLGDEHEARKQDKGKGRVPRLEGYEQAVRANRQLAIALQAQGLNEDAARFAYRAQVMQRKVLWLQRDFGHWLFSMLLALLSGYGYRIWRILAAYMVVVSLFAVAYFLLGLHYPPHLHLDQAYLESMTAFHGRVFLEQFGTNTPQIWLTAFEAITGLVIEGVFIAMLIQRFFGK